MAKRKVHWKALGTPKIYCGAESLTYDYKLANITCERCRELAKKHDHYARRETDR